MFQIWFLDYFLMSMSWASELEESLSSFAGSDSTSVSILEVYCFGYSLAGNLLGWGKGAIIRGRRLF